MYTDCPNWRERDRDTKCWHEYDYNVISYAQKVTLFHVFCTVHCDIVTQHKPTKCTIFPINIKSLLSPTCFEPRGFILRDSCICSFLAPFTCIGVNSLVGRRMCSSVFIGECVGVCSRDTPTHSPILCVYNCLPADEPTRFVTCRRQQKLNTNIENCAFRWVCKYKNWHIRILAFCEIRQSSVF